MTEVHSHDFDLIRNAHGRLVYTDRASGRSHEGVVPVRAFPVAAPDQCIALIDADGQELQWIASLDELSAPVRRLIEEELGGREFLPIIRRIDLAAGKRAPGVWQVETDRGRTELTIKGEDSIRRIGQGALLVSDVHGVQFLIPDLQALDGRSRRILDRFM